MTMAFKKLDWPNTELENGGSLYETENYLLHPAEEAGYHIRNKETYTVEVYSEQLPGALLALLSIQEAYEEIVEDPVKAYNDRKYAARQRQARPSIMGPGGNA